MSECSSGKCAPGEIGTRVRSARKAMGLSQERLARRTDLSTATLRNLEQGAILDPHVSTLSEIARALEVPTCHLLGEQHE